MDKGKVCASSGRCPCFNNHWPAVRVQGIMPRAPPPPLGERRIHRRLAPSVAGHRTQEMRNRDRRAMGGPTGHRQPKGCPEPSCRIRCQTKGCRVTPLFKVAAESQNGTHIPCSGIMCAPQYLYLSGIPNMVGRICAPCLRRHLQVKADMLALVFSSHPCGRRRTGVLQTSRGPKDPYWREAPETPKTGRT